LQQRRRPETDAANLTDSTPPISAASAAGIFAEGSRFGAYVIGPCIGHGGMARIYRAEHEGLCRQVALKVLTTGVEQGTEGRARFLREARIAAAIKHPNVVNIFDIGVENQIPYLVMELLVGQDLESLLSSHGALSEHTIIDIIIPVVAGLVAVHDAGVVHRDLKPGNIYLSKGPNEEVEPKLLDFGISKAVGGGDKMRLTSTQGLLMGTPLYMSPEAMLGTDMTPASDQYSLGVVLYECATGINPFMADSVAETARRVTTGGFTPISEQAIRPSRRLQTIIERSMSLDPKHRYRDMRALGQELLTLAGQRTRITWGLTFGEVAAAVRAHHARELDEEAIALAQTRAPKRNGRVSAWPLLAAACVGVATVTAFTLSNRGARNTESSPPPSPTVAAAPPAMVVRPLEAPRAAPETPRAEPAADTPPAAARAEPPRAAAKDADEPSRAITGADQDSAAQANEEDDNGAASPRQRARWRPRPRVQPRAVEPPPPEAPRELPDTPEWIIEHGPRPRSHGSNPVQMGTNDAPIFD
jgi:eukaryotic-like serine/threonine-protein kinase